MLETFIMESNTGVNGDEEVKILDNNATPLACQRDVRALDSHGDRDIQIDEPYKTPVVLRRQKKKPAPAPAPRPVNEAEFEQSEVEESQQGKASFKGDKDQRKANKGKARELPVAQVCFFLLIDLG
jgi:hypothetical protein